MNLSAAKEIVRQIEERIFNKFARSGLLEQVVQDQVGLCLRTGVSDAFQAGYLEALRWSLNQAGYPETAQMIAARAMTSGWVMAQPPSSEDAA